MEYVISFSDVMTAIIGLGGTVMMFFIKRWFNQIEEKDKEIKEIIEKNDQKVNERINKLEEKTEGDIQQLQKDLSNIKGDFALSFVPREDFFRIMNGVEDRIKNIDQKIDKLLFINK